MTVTDTLQARASVLGRCFLTPYGLVACLSILLLVILVRYAGHLALSDGQARFWDILLKGLGGIAVLIGSAIAVSRHFVERTAANEARMAEARKPFNETRQRVYLELVEATGTIGNIDDRENKTRQDASSQFWLLYWSTAPMVSDRIVGLALDEYASVLCDLPEDGVALRNASMNLARACGSSLGFDDFRVMPVNNRKSF